MRCSLPAGFGPTAPAVLALACVGDLPRDRGGEPGHHGRGRCRRRGRRLPPDRPLPDQGAGLRRAGPRQRPSNGRWGGHNLFIGGDRLLAISVLLGPPGLPAQENGTAVVMIETGPEGGAGRSSFTGVPARSNTETVNGLREDATLVAANLDPGATGSSGPPGGPRPWSLPQPRNTHEESRSGTEFPSRP